ncbi:MAG: 30S ribosomal protein S6 [Candidatus Omnitrophica bacterium]|nr:30S ribosomal protein S6 [Candidatus Omnitrophota bacterium]MBU4458037.1 30S ribosomal protein S6 [Candidatus Omnitrophota bacterium]
MNSYEGLFLLKPDLTKEDLDKALGQVQGIFSKHKGSQDSVKEWGKQRIAYPVKKYKEGFFYLINFQIGSDGIAKIKRAFSLNESILRVMITKA